MRRPVLLIFINAMILIIVFALLTQSLVIVQRLAKADKVSGQVEVQRSGKGKFKALSQGGMIKTGDVIRSGKSSTAEFKWADGTRWKMMPQTVITVKKSSYNAVKKAEQSQLQLSGGKVFIRIMKALKPSSQFEVETPTAVAAVRGTIFSVEYKNGKSQIAVFKGQVKVSGVNAGNPSAPAAHCGNSFIDPGTIAESAAPGQIALHKNPQVEAEFQKESSIVLPELSATIETLSKGGVWVRGATEAGNTVTIDGAPVRVLGNGAFRRRLKFAGQSVIVVATDKHGAKATQTLYATPPKR